MTAEVEPGSNVVDLAARVVTTRAKLLRIFGPTILKGSTAIEASFTDLLCRLEDPELAREISPATLEAMLDSIEHLTEGYGRFVAVARDTLVGPATAPGTVEAVSKGEAEPHVKAGSRLKF